MKSGSRPLWEIEANSGHVQIEEQRIYQVGVLTRISAWLYTGTVSITASVGYVFFSRSVEMFVKEEAFGRLDELQRPVFT